MWTSSSNMEPFSRQVIYIVLIMVQMSCCSTQTALGNQQRNQILGEVFQSMGETTSNSTNINDTYTVTDSSNVTDVTSYVEDPSNLNGTFNTTDAVNLTPEALNNTLLINVINKTLSEPGTDLPATIRAIIGFMATRKYSTGADESNGSQQTNTVETDNSNVSTVMTTTSRITSEETVATEPPRMATEHVMTADMSTMAHIPDGQIVDAYPDSANPDTRSRTGETSPGDDNPIIQREDEPVVAPSVENQEGSLPLVLGSAIVVIFVAGVIGATIKAKLRKRKLANKERLSESSSSDIELERGLDNPAFIGIDKSNTDVSIMFNSHPKLESHMKFDTPATLLNSSRG